MHSKKKIFPALVIILNCCFLCAPASEGKSTSLAPEDIIIKNHIGPMKMTNPNGGYIIDNIFGNAELKAAGSIRIGKIDGDLTVSTPIGDIEIGEATGNVAIDSQAGNVSINKAHKHVFVEAGLGEVVIQSAKSVEVNNISGGDVKVLDVTEYSKIVTRGSILLVMNNVNSRSELCNLSSSEGDISLHLPENMGADIEIQIPLSEDPNRETRIESDFAFSMFKQRCLEKQLLILTTIINKGGGKINLYLAKGNIYFRALQAGRSN